MQVCLVGFSHELGNQAGGCGLATTTPPRVTVSLNRLAGPPSPHTPSRRRPLSFLYLLCFELGRLALTERPRPRTPSARVFARRRRWQEAGAGSFGNLSRINTDGTQVEILSATAGRSPDT